MNVVIDSDTLQLISLFERMTRARVKDCLPVEGEDRIVFVVNKGSLRNALGKRGENVKKLRERIKKIVDVIEYSPDPEKFVRNIFHNFKVKKVKIDNGASGLTAYVTVDPKDKGRAIGREGKNLKLARKILARHHKDIANIMIL
jgi:N utilization substance protein A